MILALDTDVLVALMMAGAPSHDAARSLVQSRLRQKQALALVPQTLYELLHVCTDPRRFETPMTMVDAIDRARALWNARDTVRIEPATSVPLRAMELLERHRLGRKRILDTVFAATLEAAGIRHLATFNGADFEIFGFLTVVQPR